MAADLSDWFRTLTGNTPHHWQSDLATDPVCGDRLIRVPTGLGKTAGTVLAWLWNRVQRRDPAWPRRLVFCLPMRVLVEQTEAEVRSWIRRMGEQAAAVAVHRLMGGSDIDEWHLTPEQDAVLVGTQDMLLSRALNRGYASPRARWPIEFGLLNQDALWVMDEVQLMDVGLATSAQLQAFRQRSAGRSARPCRTWWMSATLQRGWLESVDTRELVAPLDQLAIPTADRVGSLWEVRKRRLDTELIPKPADIARRVAALHASSESGDHGRITLAVFNTVDVCMEVHAQLEKLHASPDLRLVHSRFRGAERRAWRDGFLSRRSCAADVDRIIVATQVVEAGVDISATTLVTELAPWPSLVQRFGRAARYGGAAQVLVVDRDLDEKKALPYALDELGAARAALEGLDDVAQGRLEDFEASLSDASRATLYPYAPQHLLTERELFDLFDTTADLTGADLDISRFIRSGDERDVLVFWRDVPSTGPLDECQPARDELCPVSFLKAREWLCKKGERLVDGCRAWVWSYLEGEWRLASKRDLTPGKTILVDRAFGGYDAALGFTGRSRDVPSIVPAPPPRDTQLADAAENREDLSASPWKTIATHGREVGAEARRLAIDLAPYHADVFDLAGRWHDLGKAHPAFQASIRPDGRPARNDLAKAPKEAWLPPKAMYRIDTNERRKGFRHELASALCLFGVLRRCRPDHPALLGDHRELLSALGYGGALDGEPPTPIEAEILALGTADFDLLAYLVASHHGKVRMSLHASPVDQDYVVHDERGLPIRGVRCGDVLPLTALCDAAGEAQSLPATVLALDPAALGLSPSTGASWTERALGLLDRHGPFALAFFEAILRAADVRASRWTTPDPLLGDKP